MGKFRFSNRILAGSSWPLIIFNTVFGISVAHTAIMVIVDRFSNRIWTIQTFTSICKQVTDTKPGMLSTQV